MPYTVDGQACGLLGLTWSTVSGGGGGVVAPRASGTTSHATSLPWPPSCVVGVSAAVPQVADRAEVPRVLRYTVQYTRTWVGAAWSESGSGGMHVEASKDHRTVVSDGRLCGWWVAELIADTARRGAPGSRIAGGTCPCLTGVGFSVREGGFLDEEV